MEITSIIKVPNFDSVAEAREYARTQSTSPKKPSEKYALDEYLYIYRAFNDRYIRLTRYSRQSYGFSTELRDFVDDVEALDFWPEWFDPDDLPGLLKKINTLDQDQIIIANMLLVMFRDFYPVAMELIKSFDPNTYAVYERRARAFDNALQEHCRQVIRQAAAEAGKTISEAELKEQTEHLNARMPNCLLTMERINTILPAVTPQALSNIPSTLEGISQAFYLLAEERSFGSNGLYNIIRDFYTYRPDLVLIGSAKLTEHFGTAPLNTILDNTLNRFDVLRMYFYANNITYKPDNTTTLNLDGTCLRGQIIENNIQGLNQAEKYTLRLRNEGMTYDGMVISVRPHNNKASSTPNTMNPFYNPLYMYMPENTILGKPQAWRQSHSEKVFEQLNILAAVELEAARKASDKKQAYIHYCNAEQYLAEYANLDQIIVAPRVGKLAADRKANIDAAKAINAEMQSELDFIQTNLPEAGSLAATLELMADKKDYLTLYYAIREPEEKVWRNITAMVDNFADALLVFKSPIIPDTPPDILIRKITEYFEADPIGMAMWQQGSPEQLLAAEIQKFYAKKDKQYSQTAEEVHLLAKLGQIFRSENIQTGRPVQLVEYFTPPVPPPQISTSSSADPLETKKVVRTEIGDIKNIPDFGSGFCEYDWSIWDNIPVNNIDNMHLSDLDVDNGTYSFSSFLNTFPQFNTNKGFIYDGIYYVVGADNIIRAADASKYTYDKNTGVIVFRDTDLCSGITTVNGKPFYKLEVTPQTAAGNINVADYDPSAGYRLYTPDGAIDIPLNNSGIDTLNISLEQFITICQSGGLYIGVPGDDSHPYAVISPVSLVSSIVPAKEELNIELKEQKDSVITAQYSGLFSVREVEYTNLAAATPQVVYQGTDVSSFFAPKIEYFTLGRGKVRYENGLLFGAGEVIVRATYWELDADGNPIQRQRDLKYLFPEKSEYISADKVELPAGLGLNYRTMPVKLDVVTREVLERKEMDLLTYFKTVFATTDKNGAAGFYLNIKGEKTYIPIAKFAKSHALYLKQNPDITVTGWEDLPAILSIYKNIELTAEDIAVDAPLQVSRPVGLTLTPELGIGYESSTGLFLPIKLHFGLDRPLFSLNVSLGDELNPETRYQKITGNISVLGAPFAGCPELQFFANTQGEIRIIEKDYPVAGGTKTSLGLLYDWRISPDMRWRNALGGKFLAVFLDTDIQSTAWKLEYESVFKYKIFSPYIKTGVLLAQNELFLAENALYKDFTQDMEFNQLELGLSLRVLDKDRIALDLMAYEDIFAHSVGGGVITTLNTPKKYRWDIGARFGFFNLGSDFFNISGEAKQSNVRLAFELGFIWPKGWFLRADYSLELAANMTHKFSLLGGIPIQFK